MKEKILEKIKEKLGKTSLSERTLNAKAEQLAKRIKDEASLTDEVIDDAVEDLKTLEGQYRHDLAEEIEKQSKIKKDDKSKKQLDDDPEPNTNNELLDKLKAIEERLNASDKKNHNTEIIKKIHEILKDKGADNEFIRDVTLKGLEIGDNDTAESLADKCKVEYDKNFKSAYGDGYIPPKGNVNTGEYKSGAYSDVVNRLRASGKLPQQKEQ